MQNLISLSLTDQDLADFDAALATLRRLMAPMIALKPEDRRELNKMGPKSEAFCSQVLALLANNPGIVPPNLGLSEAVADQKALAQLRPRFALLHQLAEKADDTEMALGSDIITTAFEGYRLLSVSGQGEALKNARRELSRRFSRTRREQEETTAA
jgi:hypothetical protein